MSLQFIEFPLHDRIMQGIGWNIIWSVFQIATPNRYVELVRIPLCWMGRDSPVGIATGYGLEVRGSNLGGVEIFRTPPDRPWAHLVSCTMSTGTFPGVKQPGRDAGHRPLLVLRSRKSRAIPLPLSGPSGLLRSIFTFLPLCWELTEELNV
jgi:hypothetical protein